MKELLAPHWILGAALSVSGALAFRLGPRFVSGTALVVVQILGLVFVTVGLFVAMRGVSRVAQSRPPLEGDEAVRHIPQLRRRPKDKS
jgi:uncharacterized protein YneF (UPF0154 family)